MNNERLSHTDTAIWTGIISNFSIAIVKGIVGYISGSRALMSDAMHTAANAVSILVDRLPIVGGVKRSDHKALRASGQPAVPFMSIIFSVIILMGGLQIAVSAIRDISTGIPETPSELALITVLISLGVNEIIFQYHVRQFKKDDRQLEAHSENHRFGLYSSLIVLIGLFLSWVGPTFKVQVLLYMDSIAALIVSGLVFRQGYNLIVRCVNGSSSDILQHNNHADYLDTIQRVHGVITIEDLRVQEFRQTRQGQVNLDIKVSVNPRITVWEAHEIAGRIKNLLLHRFVHISDVNVVVVPYEPGYPYKSNYDLVDNDLPTLPQ
ncbi:cation diffusion facilitator family transporter [Paenibacillus dakarensis]|uniref:cation diffusion facilitator family transporter n=1 Tax=Paenibacillus dakarensis TaxID=1527293 RepID=UPI0006D549A1|nr:cation diffusion facilitator family transporter [Paenibacillus dakarensis]